MKTYSEQLAALAELLIQFRLVIAEENSNLPTLASRAMKDQIDFQIDYINIWNPGRRLWHGDVHHVAAIAVDTADDETIHNETVALIVKSLEAIA